MRSARQGRSSSAKSSIGRVLGLDPNVPSSVLGQLRTDHTHSKFSYISSRYMSLTKSHVKGWNTVLGTTHSTATAVKSVVVNMIILIIEYLWRHMS